MDLFWISPKTCPFGERPGESSDDRPVDPDDCISPADLGARAPCRLLPSHARLFGDDASSAPRGRSWSRTPRRPSSHRRPWPCSSGSSAAGRPKMRSGLDPRRARGPVVTASLSKSALLLPPMSPTARRTPVLDQAGLGASALALVSDPRRSRASVSRKRSKVPRARGADRRDLAEGAEHLRLILAFRDRLVDEARVHGCLPATPPHARVLSTSQCTRCYRLSTTRGARPSSTRGPSTRAQRVRLAGHSRWVPVIDDRLHVVVSQHPERPWSRSPARG